MGDAPGLFDRARESLKDVGKRKSAKGPVHRTLWRYGISALCGSRRWNPGGKAR